MINVEEKLCRKVFTLRSFSSTSQPQPEPSELKVDIISITFSTLRFSFRARVTAQGRVMCPVKCRELPYADRVQCAGHCHKYEAEREQIYPPT
jgi:hypothetical protein